MSRNIRTTGFTITELLAVIAAFSIVAVLLFPVLSKARGTTHQELCQSNLKKIGIGILQYAQDYDRTMPFATHGFDWNFVARTTANRKKAWMDDVLPYVKTPQTFNCPTMKYDEDELYGPYDGKFTDGDRHWGSYSANNAFRDSSKDNLTAPFGNGTMWAGGPTAEVYATKLSKIVQPATTLMVADGVGGPLFVMTNAGTGLIFDSARSGAKVWAQNTAAGVSSGYEARHFETTNVLWCDGHVAAMKLSDLDKRDATGVYIPVLSIEDD